METTKQLNLRPINVKHPNWKQLGPQSQVKWKDWGDFSVHFSDQSTIHCWAHVKTERDSKSPVEDKDVYFNEYQFFIYNRCLKGVSVYSPFERSRLPSGLIKIVEQRHKKCIEVVNLFKQEILIEKTNKVMRDYLEFMRAPFDTPLRRIINSEFIQRAEPDPEFICNFTLSELKITKKMLADKLIKTGVLPQRFYEITIHDDPRWKKLSKETRPVLD